MSASLPFLMPFGDSFCGLEVVGTLKVNRFSARGLQASRVQGAALRRAVIVTLLIGLRPPLRAAWAVYLRCAPVLHTCHGLDRPRWNLGHLPLTCLSVLGCFASLTPAGWRSRSARCSITLLDLLPHVAFTGLYQPSGACETPCGLVISLPTLRRNRFAILPSIRYQIDFEFHVVHAVPPAIL
jgi:hypothetical protein